MTTAVDVAIDDLVERFVQAACDAHASVGVFRAALFGLSASELHRMIDDTHDAPDDIVSLASQLTTLAMTVRELTIAAHEERAASTH